MCFLKKEEVFMITINKSKYLVLFVLFFNVFGSEMPSQDVNGVTLFDATYKEGDKEITKQVIYRKDIFEYVTGMKEPDFVQKYKETNTMPNILASSNNFMQNLSHANLTLKELRNQARGKLSTNNNGNISIIHVDVVKFPYLRHLIDIGALQAAYPGAVFQTASRPNGLEGQQISFLNNQESFNGETDGFNKIIGKFAVQGEEAQISAAMRGIYEIYCVPERINLFDTLNITLNAKGDLTDIDPDLLTKSSMEQLSNLIRLDHWKNVPVTTGYANVLFQSKGIEEVKNLNAAARAKNPDDANVLVSPPHLISQVNVSALDVNKNRGGTKTLFEKKCPDNWADNMDKLAQAAIRAAYEGTIYCALLDNKKDVFFTLVGCGSFENKLDWVADTLEYLQSKGIIKDSGLNIRIVAVEINGHFQKENAWERLKNLATTTGGTISSNGE
jgi:hypothetical protein